jgi:NADPH:quinone reductase-like Zn-dependent oxidoreductase
MDAAVLHTLGKPPRCEQFPEPIAGDGEVIVHVHAASLKPIDKQLASGSHYASPRELPLVCGSDGVGHLSDGQRVLRWSASTLRCDGTTHGCTPSILLSGPRRCG